ncbi:MAG: YitT family protein [Clostridia bacterium]
MKKSNKIIMLKNALILLCASISFSVGMELFLIPNNLNIGGFCGLAQIFNLLNLKYVSTGLWLILINIPALIIAYIFLDKKFVLRTSFEIVLIGGFMELIHGLNFASKLGMPDFANITVIAIAGGALVAISAALTFSIDGSTGGSDILGILVQKKYKITYVSRILLIIDVIIVVTYSLIIGKKTLIFYSITTLVAYQIALEFMLNGFSNAIMFEIISDDCDLIVEAIETQLDRGSTMFKAVGTYSKEEKEVVVCVVRKRQAAEARELIKKVSPNSFTYSIQIKEVIGKGFRNINF